MIKLNFFRILLFIVYFILSSFLVSCNSSSNALGAQAVTLISIKINSPSFSIPVGVLSQFSAVGFYSDGSKKNLNNLVKWNSSVLDVATVDNTGIVTPLAAGNTVITATLNNIEANISITINTATLKSMSITPINSILPLGLLQQQFSLIGIYSNNSKQDLTLSATWFSSNQNVATVSKGLVTLVSAGDISITATFGSMNASTQLLVTSATLKSIIISPSQLNLPQNVNKQLHATGVFSDNSHQDITSVVTWNSSASSIATISNTSGSYGVLTTILLGSSNITATFGGIISKIALLTVANKTLQSVTVTPVNVTTQAGVQKQLKATGNYSDKSTYDLTNSVLWSSADSSIVTVSNSFNNAGLATTFGSGSTTVMASFGAKSGSTSFSVDKASLQSIKVTPSSQNTPQGLTGKFIATGYYSDQSSHDITENVIWSSSAVSVAQVSNTSGTNGVAKAIKSGSSTISATIGSVKGSAIFNVIAPVLSTIVVTPEIISAPVGTETQFTATGYYSDGSSYDLTTFVTWSLSVESVADISNVDGNNGLAIAISAGNTNVIATLNNISDSASYTVTGATLKSITIAPLESSIYISGNQQYTATGIYTDGSIFDITEIVFWQSSNTAVAQISNDEVSPGLATPVGAGSTTISATFGELSTNTLLTINPINLLSIAISPTLNTMSIGDTLQLTATATYSDGSSKNITNIVTWSSPSTTTTPLATVSNLTGSNGLISAFATGAANVAANLESVTSNNATVNILAPQYAYITNENDTANSIITVCNISISNGTLTNCVNSNIQVGGNPDYITFSNGYAYITNVISSYINSNNVVVCAANLNGILSDCKSQFVYPVSQVGGSLIGITPYNGFMYIASNIAAMNSGVVYCTVSDGTLGGCQPASNLNTDLFGIAINNGYFFGVSKFTGNLYSCIVNANGLLSACNILGNSYSISAIAFSNGNTYVAGSDAISYGNVSVCAVNAGTLGNSCFQPGTSFPNNSSVVAINNGYAYISSFSNNKVFYCKLNSDGSIPANCNSQTTGSGFTRPIGIAFH